MMNALTAPLMVAAGVLCVAGAAKLRAPDPAVEALRAGRLPADRWLVRAFALAELALGTWVAISPSGPGAAAVAFLYAMFSGLSLLLSRRRASCGCFGTSERPASRVQSVLSAALAVVAALAAAAPPHGLAWIAGQSAPLAAATLIAVAGAVYATVIAYTELPAAWGAWSAR